MTKTIFNVVGEKKDELIGDRKMWIREPRDGGLKLLLREFFEVLI
jgi:hypothetical protein